MEHAMSVKHLFISLLGAILAVLLLLLILMFVKSSNEAAVTAAERNRYLSYKLADELRQSSDDLTRMARTYVVTGDRRFEEFYRKILDIRNGEAPRPAGYEGIYWDLVSAGQSVPGEESKAFGLDATTALKQFSSPKLGGCR